MAINEIGIIIPTLEPDEKIIKLAESLIDTGFDKILVVNDGSGPEYEGIFDQLKEHEEVTVLVHEQNRGKGAGIKTGISYFDEVATDAKGVITVDGDGQHLPKDIARLAQELLKRPDALHLGSRTFDDQTIPWRSRFGNKVTASLFKVFSGSYIRDTQTGLRGFSRRYFDDFLKVDGNTYEYEMNQLFYCAEVGIPILSIDIETVYIDDNASSHFNPILDSIRVYGTFIKYALSSGFSFLVDILLYSLFVYLLQGKTPAYIMISTILARAVSMIVNYGVNYLTVFSSANRKTKSGSFIRYLLLALVQVLASGVLTTVFVKWLGSHEVATKIIIDVILFFFSFYIQKKYVFAKEK